MVWASAEEKRENEEFYLRHRDPQERAFDEAYEADQWAVHVKSATDAANAANARTRGEASGDASGGGGGDDGPRRA